MAIVEINWFFFRSYSRHRVQEIHNTNTHTIPKKDRMATVPSVENDILKQHLGHLSGSSIHILSKSDRFSDFTARKLERTDFPEQESQFPRDLIPSYSNKR